MALITATLRNAQFEPANWCVGYAALTHDMVHDAILGVRKLENQLMHVLSTDKECETGEYRPGSNDEMSLYP
jgi:hypothetical protein